MVRVAIVENLENTSLGPLAQALDEVEAELEWFRPRQDGSVPLGAHDHDGLIVLGGEQSAVDDAAHPYLPALADVMRRFGDADKSVLGICLGAQLLARAYGGENILGSAREFAWTPLDVTPEGAADPLFRDLGSRFESFQWHVDTFTLPDKAVRLVSGPVVANQCFRVGRAAYGSSTSRPASTSSRPGWSSFATSSSRRRPAGSTATPRSPRATPRRRTGRAMPSRAPSYDPCVLPATRLRPADTVTPRPSHTCPSVGFARDDGCRRR